MENIQINEKESAETTNESNSFQVNYQSHHKPNKKTVVSLLASYTLNNIINVFVTTFLVSYLYTISENYVLNIGLFYMFNYMSMGIFYFVISKFIDKTSRVGFYRVAIIIKFLFILMIIFIGKDVAQYVALAGILYGFSEACYWTSYNIMKNELVSKRIMKKYSAGQLILEKFGSVVIPIVLGKIIDSDSFKTSAYIVLAIVAVEIILSFFIKSKRPENSSFDLKDYNQKLNALGEKKKLVTYSYLISIFYGFTTIVTPLNTILIMYTFNSNFSLGIITSVFAACAMVLLVILTTCTKPGKRGFIFPIAAVIPVVAALVEVIFPLKVTAIIFNGALVICSVVHSYTFDVARNLIIKRLGLYDCIAEYQAELEGVLEIFRMFSFGIMALVGFIVANFGISQLLIATKVLLMVFVFAIAIVDMMMLKYEKNLRKHEIYLD